MTDPSSIHAPDYHGNDFRTGLSGATKDNSQSNATGARQSFMSRLKSALWPGGDSTRDGIRELIEDGRAEGVLRPEEQKIIGNLVSLEDKWVDDVMVPRADIIALPADTPVDDMVRKFIESGYSRLPVYRESLDDVFGMLHIKDLMHFWGAQGTQEFSHMLRDVMFVPPNMPILDLLMRVQSNGVHMALVVDEYGGVDGLLTIEDLVEAVVGEITDTHDRSTTPEIRVQHDGSLIVDARVPVADLESHVGLHLLDEDREEDIDTIGGLIFDLADRVPARGEEISHPSGLRMIVLSADPRRIHSIRVLLPRTPAAE